MLAVRWQEIDHSGKLRVERSLEQTRKGGVQFQNTENEKEPADDHAPALPHHRLARAPQSAAERWLALGLGRVRDDDLVLATWEGQARTPGRLSKDYGAGR